MRTIYWVLTTGEVSACKVLFASEERLFVRTENDIELLLRKASEGVWWFTTREAAEAAAEIIKKINNYEQIKFISKTTRNPITN